MLERIVIDEMGNGWQAVCWAAPGECSWCSPTIHADDFSDEDDPMDAAYGQATIEGNSHLANRHPE